MIEGLKLDFTSEQLVDHLKKREEYHSQEAHWYESQIVSLIASRVDKQGRSHDPISSLKRSEGEHSKKVDFFRVMREHVVPDETYRLSEGDLTRLELISGAHW